MGQDSDTADKTERAKRFDVWAPVEIRPEERGARLAIVHNASATGLLIGARTKLEPGQDVQLKISTRSAKQPMQSVNAQVVRLDAFDPDTHWPWSIAVRFTDPAEKLVPELERLTPPRY